MNTPTWYQAHEAKMVAELQKVNQNYTEAGVLPAASLNSEMEELSLAYQASLEKHSEELERLIRDVKY